MPLLGRRRAHHRGKFLSSCSLPCLPHLLPLLSQYAVKHPSVEIICYTNGYKGLLLGESIIVTPGIRATAQALHLHGGSPIGNSRVKMTNVKDCVKRGLCKEGENPQRVAADQLIRDGVEVLHTIGGDDTNTAAADLAAFLEKEGYKLTVIGLPKTIDNDVFPITQSLGEWTAAEEGAKFFENVGAEVSSSEWQQQRSGAAATHPSIHAHSLTRVPLSFARRPPTRA